ncbi:hypothetical protein [Martelella alba]|uniref:Uncharacterized protein n=1 Tax=Martelella alba TaxID=2590451 RepID=A0ABY2SP72_9HYPH|nr:hypothetical protein [Martelella alba]TKI07394.1 hypothetical protein FCN80_05740 [Martelella alba]
MGPQQSFETIKTLLHDIYNTHLPSCEVKSSLNADSHLNYDDVYNERLNKLFASYADARRAVATGDRAAIRAALMRAKIHTLALTCFFTALEDDCIALLSHYVDAEEASAQNGGAEQPFNKRRVSV